MSKNTNNASAASKFDAYQMVTDRIVALMESGIIPWARPWSGTNAVNGAWSRRDGRSYSFVNQMLLGDPDKHYSSWEELQADIRGEWLTFKQALDLGGNVRKGEKGRKIVFFKVNERKTGKQDENGEEIVERFPILKAYTVFRVDQCEGIEQKWYTQDAESLPDIAQDMTAEGVIADYIRREGVTMNHVEGNRAYYSPALDTVVLPLRNQFKSTEEYYSTAMHELAHSTGHESRLNRLSGVAAFGDDSYSTEELTAEICSASIMATLGLDTAGTLRNSAAYVQSWLKALKNDKKMIVVASARAEKALQLLLNVVKPTPDKDKGDDAETVQDENKAENVKPAAKPEHEPEMISSMTIKHPNGVMMFADLAACFPMSQKDFKIVLPLLRYVASDTLRNFCHTLKMYATAPRSISDGKRLASNIAALEKAFPELAAC